MSSSLLPVLESDYTGDKACDRIATAAYMQSFDPVDPALVFFAGTFGRWIAITARRDVAAPYDIAMVSFFVAALQFIANNYERGTQVVRPGTEEEALRYKVQGDTIYAFALLITLGGWLATEDAVPQTNLTSQSIKVWDPWSWVIYMFALVSLLAYCGRLLWRYRGDRAQMVGASVLCAAVLLFMALTISLGHLHHSQVGLVALVLVVERSWEDRAFAGACSGIALHGVIRYGWT